MQSALGAVVTSAGELEYAMHGLAWILDAVDHEQGLRATGAMQLSTLCRHISKVARQRLTGRDLDDLEGLVSEVLVLMRRRNQLLHSHWVKNQGRTWTMLRIREFQAENVSISEIQGCTASMNAAQLRVFDLASRLAGGWLPAFVFETGRVLAYEGKTIVDMLEEILKFVTRESKVSPPERDSSSG